MKKFLSLVLALAMSLSLVTVGAGAISFKDQSEIDHKEAVEVMAAAGILNGIDGSFQPNGTLTREQAAKIIAYVAVGESTAEKLGVENAPFADVAATRWSAPYVAYAAAEGIVNGVGNNKFDPTAQVTGYQFAKMLLGVLGIEGDYTGTGWEVKVAAAADDADLFEDLDDVALSKALSREHAAQMALNAMLYVEEADQWTLYEKNSSEEWVARADFDNKKDAYMIAALKTSGSWDVRKTTDRSDCLLTDVHDVKISDTSDDYGVSATKYSNKDWDEDLIYANEDPILTYTEDFDKDELKDLRKDYTISNSNEMVTFNGQAVSNVKTADALADKDMVGATIELYGDEDTDTIDQIVVKQSQLAKVTQEKKDSITLKVDGAASIKFTDDTKDDADDFDKLSAAYDKDDYLLVFLGKDTNNKDKLIDFADAKVVSGEVNTKKGTDYVTVDGTKYEIASQYVDVKSNALGKTASEVTVGNEYDFYLNELGCIVGAEETEDNASLSDVYYVSNIFKETDNRVAGSKGTNTYKYYAELVALDGSVKEVQLESDTKNSANYADDMIGELVTISDKKNSDTNSKANNDKFDLTVWNGDGDYDVDALTAKQKDAKLTKDQTRYTQQESGKTVTYRLNSDTQYIFVEYDGTDIDVTVKTGGVAYDLSKVNDNSYIITEDGESEVLYMIIKTEDAAQSSTFSSDEVVFIKSASSEQGDGYYVQDVYTMDGEKHSWKVDDGEYGKDGKLAVGFYSYDTNDDGYIELDAIAAKDYLTVSANDKVWDDEEGFVVAAVYTGLYNTLLSVGDFEKYWSKGAVIDIETKDAVFVDLHDTDDVNAAGGKAYDSEVADLDELKDLIDDEEIHTPLLYIKVEKDGAVAIFAPDIWAKQQA